jgi:flagellar biosynthesis GTPase FlhF
MADDTKATADKTPDGAANNTDTAKAEAGTQTDKTADAPKFTQADQNALAAKIRKEEKEKYERQIAEEKRQADEAKAKEQGEYQTLADNRQKELDELKPKLEATESELSQLRPAFAALIEAELKSLPSEVVESGPAKYGEDKSLSNPLEVAAWLPKGKTLAEKLEGAPARPGAGSDPKAKAPPGDGKADEAARKSQAGMYRTF